MTSRTYPALPREAGDPECPGCHRQRLRLTTYKTGPQAGEEVWVCRDYDCRTFIDVAQPVDDADRPRAGASAQDRFERERRAYYRRLTLLTPFFLAVGVATGAMIFFAILALTAELRVAAAGGLVAILALLVFAIRLPDDVIYWGRGAEGERRVGAKLEGLKPYGFITFYDRRFHGRFGNIDAIAIGPRGVFVVETKWRGRGVEIANGRFKIGGHESTDAIEQVREQALRIQVSIAEQLNVHRLSVVPVICISNRGVEGGERVGGVRIVDLKGLARFLSSGPEILGPDEVQDLARLINNAFPPAEIRG